MRYLEQYRRLHAEKKFPGMSMIPFAAEVAELVGEFKSRTILDYGCGLGLQYSRDKIFKLWGNQPPKLYDPAVDLFQVKPSGQFDGVICTDVAEHVPEDELPAFVADLAGYARQWALISVCCRPSKHIRFDDGENVHVTVKPFAWWQEYLAPHFTGARLVLRETE